MEASTATAGTGKLCTRPARLRAVSYLTYLSISTAYLGGGAIFRLVLSTRKLPIGSVEAGLNSLGMSIPSNEWCLLFCGFHTASWLVGG